LPPGGLSGIKAALPAMGLSMRLTSGFWVAAFMRELRRRGGFAYLARRGAEEAGAIFVCYAPAGGQGVLYGPAPQVFYDESVAGGERLFMRLLEGSAADLQARWHKEQEFDPDMWLVEVENCADPAESGLLRQAAGQDKPRPAKNGAE